MNHRHLISLLVVLLVGAFLGGMWPTFNLLGLAYAKAKGMTS